MTMGYKKITFPFYCPCNNLSNRHYLKGLLLISFILLFISCRLTVSLTGGDIDPRAKTVYIQTFRNNTSLGSPALSDEFTSALKDRIQGQTPLTIINTPNGDYSLEGEITGYHIQPVAIQGDQTAAMNRLTISVHVRFTNKFDENKNFDQTFSRYTDYPSNQNLTAIESSLMSTINEALTEDIFNKAFVNW